MNKLLAEILDAHGGVGRWGEYAKVDATIVTGGGFFALKGFSARPESTSADGVAARGTIICHSWIAA